MKIGILGAGQLALMLAQAAQPLGLEIMCLSPEEKCPASRAADILMGDYQNPETYNSFAQKVDLVTFENENIDCSVLLETKTQFSPNILALKISQDRLLEKEYLQKISIPTAEYRAVNSIEDLKNAIVALGLPAVLKTRRMGYDGKGQAVLHEAREIKSTWEKVSAQGPLILEKWLPFEYEVSLIGVRAQDGSARFYDLAENHHEDGILRYSRVHYQTKHPLQQQAEAYLTKLMNGLNYVGTCTLEFFVVENQLIANEIAPRVHNSGHWTIEGTPCSQFENHLRAICNLPLGETNTVAHAAMINCLGYEPKLHDVLRVTDTHYHTYFKTARPGRKVAHITTLACQADTLEQKLESLLAMVNN